MIDQAEFWTKIAPGYRKRPVSDTQAYEQTLERVQSYLQPGARVLELGSGTGGTAQRLAPLVSSYVASDFSQGMIDQAAARDMPSNVDLKVADVFAPQFEAGSFDLVMGLNLFHLVEDLEAQFAQVHHLLAPGGVFISKSVCLGERNMGFKFGVLRAAIPLMQRLGKAPFVQYLTMRNLEDRIAHAGFRIVETGNYPARPPSHFVVAEKL